MKRKLKMGIALIMAMVLILNLPLGVFAAQEQYISEVKIGYGADGKAALKAAGYTVRDDLNMNPGGEGGDVWLGYKVTYDKSEAITDMALMQQDGGYSFQGWNDEITTMMSEISSEVDRFEASIQEFQENLAAGSAYAEMAKKFLNIYADDDGNADTADDTGYALGDLFEAYDKTPAEGKTAVTRDTVVRIFMQGNVQLVQSVRYYLALGCAEYDPDYKGENFITRMTEAEATGETDPDVKNTDREAVLSALTDMVEWLEEFEQTLENGNIYDVVNRTGELTEEEKAADEAALDAYLASFSDDDEKRVFAEDLEFYAFLRGTGYTDNLETEDGAVFSLYDLLKLPTDFVDDDTPVMDDYVDPLVTSLTKGELGLLGSGSVDFRTIFIINAAAMYKESSESYLADLEAAYQNILEAADGTKVSVYDGVDRSLFIDSDTVALTSKALRDKAESAGSNFGRTEEKNGKLNKYALILAGSLFAVGVASFTAAALSISSGVTFITPGFTGSTATAFIWARAEGLFGTYEASFRSAYFVRSEITSNMVVKNGTLVSANVFRTALTVLGVVAIIAATVLTIITLVNYWQSKKDTTIPEVDYTEIPRALMDLRYKGDTSTEKYYVPYYAAKNIAAPAGSTNTLELYGDLNALCKHCVWLTLYTTKDENAGTPLTTDFKIVTNSTVPEDYLGVHMFGNTSAANLNQYQVNGAAAVYLYVKPAAVSTGTASVFAENPGFNVILALGVFLLGAAASGFAVGGYYRKREKKTA